MDETLFITFLTGLCAVIGALLTFILSGIASSLREMNTSVSLLNERMATVVTKVDNHEMRLHSIESIKR